MLPVEDGEQALNGHKELVPTLAGRGSGRVAASAHVVPVAGAVEGAVLKGIAAAETAAVQGTVLVAEHAHPALVARALDAPQLGPGAPQRALGVFADAVQTHEPRGAHAL